MYSLPGIGAAPHKEQLQARARQRHQAAGASTALGDAPGKLFPRGQNGRSCDCRRGEHPTGRCPQTIPGHLIHHFPIFRTSLLCKQTSMALRFWYGCRALEGSPWGEWIQRGAGRSTLERERPKSRLPLFPTLI